jgi:hypothetical protein
MSRREKSKGEATPNKREHWCLLTRSGEKEARVECS